jgi:hypothetical protein
VKRTYFFMGALAAIGTAGMPRLVRAQVIGPAPVFDAANYQQAITMATQTHLIVGSTAEAALRALSELQELQSMNSLSVGNIYRLAMPFMSDIVKAANLNVQTPPQMDKLLVQFATAFPSWNPGGSYAALYSNALYNARRAMATAAQEAQAADNRHAQTNATIQTLITNPPSSIKDGMAISQYLGASTIASINDMSSTMSHMYVDQGNFLQAEYERQEAERRSPAVASLISTFSYLPTTLQNVNIN